MGFAHTASEIDSLQDVVASFVGYRQRILDIGKELGTDFDVQGLAMQIDDIITGRAEFPDELPVTVTQAKRLQVNYTGHVAEDYQRVGTFQSVVNDPTAKFDLSLYNLLLDANFLSRKHLSMETPEAFGRTVQGDRVDCNLPDGDIHQRIGASPYEVGYLMTAYYVSAVRALIGSELEGRPVLTTEMSDGGFRLSAPSAGVAGLSAQDIFHDVNGFDPTLMQRLEEGYGLQISSGEVGATSYLQVQFLGE